MPKLVNKALRKCLLCANLITARTKSGVCHKCQEITRKMSRTALRETLRVAAEKDEKAEERKT